MMFVFIVFDGVGFVVVIKYNIYFVIFWLLKWGGDILVVFFSKFFKIFCIISFYYLYDGYFV